MSSWDVIVVGAGYLGCACSYYLSHAGVKTLLIDQGGIGAGASSANYGNIQVQDAELTHSLPMVLAGKATYETLPAELEHDIGLRRLGSLLIAEKKSHIPTLKQRAKVLQAAGVPVEWLDTTALHEVEPHLDVRQTYGALFSPDEMQLNPFKLMNAFTHRARQWGCTLQLHTTVNDFLCENGRLLGLKTNRGDFYGGVTILATGAWTRVLGRKLGLEIPVQHVHGQAAATNHVGNILQNYLSTAAFFEEAHGDSANEQQSVLAIAPTAHGNLLLGEVAQVVDHHSTRTNPAAIYALARLGRRFLPALASGSIVRAWAAPAAFTADGRPFLGPVAGLDGLLLAAAFKSTVVITPLVGQLVTQLVLNERADLDITPFLLSRINSY